jgi:hypothetical protein
VAVVQRTDVEGQRSEVRDQKSETRNQRPEIRDQKSEVRSQYLVFRRMDSGLKTIFRPDNRIGRIL